MLKEIVQRFYRLNLNLISHKTSGSSVSSSVTIVASVNGPVVTTSVKGASAPPLTTVQQRTPHPPQPRLSSSVSQERFASSNCSTGESALHKPSDPPPFPDYYPAVIGPKFIFINDSLDRNNWSQCFWLDCGILRRYHFHRLVHHWHINWHWSLHRNHFLAGVSRFTSSVCLSADGSGAWVESSCSIAGSALFLPPHSPYRWLLL